VALSAALLPRTSSVSRSMSGEEARLLLPAEAETPPKDSGKTSPGISEDDARRDQLADGLPSIRRDPKVSQGALTGIAVLRTLVLWASCGGALFAAYKFRDAVFEETVSKNHVSLIASLCDADGPTISSLDPEPLGFLELVEEEQRKVITFEPVGEVAEELRVPRLRYYASEEFKAGGPKWSIGYSFGLFPVSELHFHLIINNTDCLKTVVDHRALLLGTAPRHGSHSMHFLGVAITQMLSQAGRQTPHAWTPTAPKFHGPMLIREDTQQVWESSVSMFGVPYARSPGWNLYWMVTIALRLAGGFALHAVLGAWVRKEWHRAVDTWIVQYDHLWATRTTRGAHSHSVTSSQGMVHHRIQCCSSFFVLDHAVGDAQFNTEDIIHGLLSSCVHGSVLVGLILFPTVMACYFPEWKPFVRVLTGLHLLSGMAYGALYYFNARYRHRRWFLYVHLGSSLAAAVHSLLYMWSAALFIMTRPFVMPKEAMVYSVSIGTVLIYVVVVGHQLNKLRDGLLSQLERKEKKGKVVGFLRYLGLDVKAIIFSVAGGALLVLLVALLILLAGEMYLSGPISSIGPVMGSTGVAFATMFTQLKAKLVAQEEASSGIRSMILDLV